MKHVVKTVALVALLATTVVLTHHSANAMKSPGAILWGYPPETFVKSLYRGVLGREPESEEVVAEWAAQATTPEGRRKVFWGFLNSPEYQSKYGNLGGAKVWTIYYRRDPNSTRYTVAKTMPRDHHGVVWGPYNYWTAIALRNYMDTFNK